MHQPAVSSFFDVIVIGGGHAGIEAAYAAQKLGSKTALITLDIEKIGLMPCNPAVGGIGKGHIVFEISALGGLMPQLCASTHIQARMLNTKKGPAVQGLRLQIDKVAYNQLSKATMMSLPHLTIIQAAVEDFIIDGTQQITGVVTADQKKIHGATVIVTSGTFLRGLMHIGSQKMAGGRYQEKAVHGLSPMLEQYGFKLGRLKTGTPPRLLRSSLDFSSMEFQQPDALEQLFEHRAQTANNSDPCYITHTTKATHEIIKQNLEKSAIYCGITGIGPRYCPSIEDKVGRFGNKESHLIFVEPEGHNHPEVYPNGISTSLPMAIQEQFIKTIPGFNHAVITKPGYAVEYDFVLPHQLTRTLETKAIAGLFFAGQINGTTGYEEAAGQGLIAGINAHQKAHKKKPFVLERHEGYLGVLIDDIVTMSIDEPYRMFTSRAEHRLLLRQDNAFIRLTEHAYQLGMVDHTLYLKVQAEKQHIDTVVAQLEEPIHAALRIELLKNNHANIALLRKFTHNAFSERLLQTIWAEIRYKPYIQREYKEIEKTKKYTHLSIPASFEYQIPGLSAELQEKLSIYRPSTLAHAQRIPGMTPAAISLLLFKLQEQQRKTIAKEL